MASETRLEIIKSMFPHLDHETIYEKFGRFSDNDEGDNSFYRLINEMIDNENDMQDVISGVVNKEACINTFEKSRDKHENKRRSSLLMCKLSHKEQNDERKKFPRLPSGSKENENFGASIDNEIKEHCDLQITSPELKLQKLISIFPNISTNVLRKKVSEFELNEKGELEYLTWVEKELADEPRKEVINCRYQILKALLPGKDDPFLLKTCNEFGFDDAGIGAFNKWLQNNKSAQCMVCFDDECIESEMLACRKGHLFCKDCVERGSKVAIGDGKTNLPCLSGKCDEYLDITTLRKALNTPIFSRWVRKIQAAEVDEAAVEGIVKCPFCPFAMIMESTPEAQPVFVCQHPDCKKESCRKCNEAAHVPLRCDEVEKDDEVAKRTYIENKMTEALIRKCYQCKRAFVKQDGCNKMVCDCGALMCYLCRLPVKGYDHFVGQGGTPEPPHKVCPLWSKNDEVHEMEVARVALEAKQAMNEQQPEVQLRIDPTVGAPGTLRASSMYQNGDANADILNLNQEDMDENDASDDYSDFSDGSLSDGESDDSDSSSNLEKTDSDRSYATNSDESHDLDEENSSNNSNASKSTNDDWSSNDDESNVPDSTNTVEMTDSDISYMYNTHSDEDHDSDGGNSSNNSIASKSTNDDSSHGDTTQNSSNYGLESDDD